ncbi:MAG: DUF72 domain-containing protein [Polyangia bacterium]
MPGRAQLSLFGGGADLDPTGPAPLVAPAHRALAEELPRDVYYGTSSYTFPGWAGVLYAGRPSEKALVDEGLSAYAAHPLLRAVGIDRTYWAPMTADAWRRYARQTPPGFVAVSKALSELTTCAFPNHPRYGDRAGRINPSFLDPELAMRDVVRPLLEGMVDKAGPLVLELAPIPERVLPDERALHARLAALLQALPRELSVVVELRTPRLFTKRYLDTLAQHRATHVVSYWSDMPTIGEQARLGAVELKGDLVLRLLQPPGSSYDVLKRAYAPFDRLHAIDEAMRNDVTAVTKRALEQGRRVFVLVGNKAEGCAPRTVFALAEQLVR